MAKKGESLSEETKAKMRASQEARRNRLREAQHSEAQAGEAAAAPLLVAWPPSQAPLPPDAPYFDQIAREHEAETEFDRFVAGLDSETRSLIDDAELRREFEAAQAEKRAERKKAAKARASLAARIAAGVLPPADAAAAALREKLAEQVQFTINLPESCYMEAHGCPALVVDGKLYRDGQTYTAPLSVYMSIREQVFRLHQAELDFKGEGRLSYLRRERASAMAQMVSA